jgi:hypothetical protein
VVVVVGLMHTHFQVRRNPVWVFIQYVCT